MEWTLVYSTQNIHGMLGFPEYPDAELVEQIKKFGYLNYAVESQIRRFAGRDRCVFGPCEIETFYFMGHFGDKSRFLVLPSIGAWKVVLWEGRHRCSWKISVNDVKLPEQREVLKEFIENRRNLFEYSQNFKDILKVSKESELTCLYLYPNHMYDIASTPSAGMKSPICNTRKEQFMVMSELGK